MNRAQLAVMLRSAQWAIDQGAFDIGAGRCTPEQQQALADQLASVVDALRANLGMSVVIEAAEQSCATDERGVISSEIVSGPVRELEGP